MAKRLLVLYSLASLAIGGCESSPNAAYEAVTLKHIRTIQLEETDSLFIGDFGSITPTSHPFRLYVPDENIHRVAVFDSLGKIIRIVGEEGQGPGELWRPMKVIVIGGQLYVKESNRFSVFDTVGTFIRTMHLPEGIYTEDRWSLNHFDGHLYVAAVDVSQRIGPTVQATPEQNTIAILDTSLQQVGMMGQFPMFYQQGEYNNRWRHLDISSEGIMLVCYSLLPDIQVYDLAKRGRPLIQTLQLTHPEYRPVKQELPIQMPVSELKKVATETSATLSVWILQERLAVLIFANRAPDYYERRGDDEAAAYYGIVASISGEQLGTLALPGPILGRDELGRLYIRLSNVPDERQIGVYELIASG